MAEVITSAGNQRIKLVRAILGRSRSRKTEAAFVAEGVRLVEEAVNVHWPMDFILFDQTLSERGLVLIDQIEKDQRCNVSEISPKPDGGNQRHGNAAGYPGRPARAPLTPPRPTDFPDSG